MVFQNPKVKKLIEKYADIWALNHATALMSWDTNTYMPRGAAERRGIAIARLSVLKQKIILSEEFKNLFKEAEKEEDLNEYERGVIRVLKRKLEFYEKVPPELLEEEAKVTTKARVVWEKAKEKSDFKSFEPHLEKIVEIERKKAEYREFDKLYDALLDLFEEGLTSDDVDRTFSQLREPLTKLFRKILDSGLFPRRHRLEEERYDREAMKYLNFLVLEYLGYDFSRGRLDVSAHPFTIDMSIDDVRITTWYHASDFRRSLGSVVHEFGHALYELQIDKRLAETPVGTGVSLGVHESQSRFWENIVWRSKAFVDFFYPSMRALLSFLKEYGPEEVYRYFCMVRPEYIRVEADEVHYPLHIILRYEIEKALIEESLSVSEIPQVWNEKMEKYVGITPPNDKLGCLQDVHWSEGYIGYFPTYAIGSILAAQIKNALEAELGKLDDLIIRGEFKKIREWLKEKIHRWGATLPPKELIKRATGENLNPKYFLEYLQQKYLT